MSRYQQRSVLQIALDIHMTVYGSFERTDEEQKQDIAFLRQRVAEWEPSIPKSAANFDNAVLRTIEAALAEAIPSHPDPPNVRYGCIDTTPGYET